MKTQFKKGDKRKGIRDIIVGFIICELMATLKGNSSNITLTPNKEIIDMFPVLSV